jgi:hypothetical protein
MAEHTKAHLWINTCIAVLAFVASGATAMLSWWTYQLKSESLGFTTRANYDCRIQFVKFGNTGVLGICASVTITNQSDIRTSIVSYDTHSVVDGATSHFSGFTELEDENGKQIALPVAIGAGDPLAYVMRVPITVPQSVTQIIDKMGGSAPLSSLTLDNLMDEVLRSAIDLIGNPVEVHPDSGRKLVTYGRSANVVIAFMRFHTGRHNTFTAKFTYPPNYSDYPTH